MCVTLAPLTSCFSVERDFEIESQNVALVVMQFPGQKIHFWGYKVAPFLGNCIILLDLIITKS